MSMTDDVVKRKVTGVQIGVEGLERVGVGCKETAIGNRLAISPMHPLVEL